MGICPSRNPIGQRRANTLAQSRRAQQNWAKLRRLVRRKIFLVLRLRRVWHKLGVWLQQAWVRDLGLERQRGALRRTAAAPINQRIFPKAKAQFRR